MNKIFKVIWSKSKQCYIVVSEIAKNKTGKKKIVVASILAALAMASSVQDVSAVTGSGGTNNFSNAGSGVSFKQGEGLAIGTNATVASGNTNTVAIGVASVANGSSSFAASGGSTASGKDGQIAIGWSSTNGKGAVAIGGTSDTASGRDTRAIGTAAVALGVGSAADGNNTFAASGGNATGESATAIGSSAIASGRGGVAVGWNAESAVNAVGIGFKAKAKANNTVAIGVEANSDNSIGDNSSSVSIGVATRARAVGSMAMGVSADASGKYSIALGSGDVRGDYTYNANYPKATGEKAIAIGYNSNSSNTAATAIGAGATASGQDSFAGGSGTAGGNSSIAIGKSSGATNDRALAVGVNAKATGKDTVAVGSGAGGTVGLGFASSIDDNKGVVQTIKNINVATTADGDNAVAVGHYANAMNSGVALGQNTLAATGGVAIGKGVFEDTNNVDAGGTVIGQDSTVTGFYSLAVGRYTFASGSTSMAMGYDASAKGNYAVAMGRKVIADGTSTAIGHHAVATNGGLAIGSQDNDASKDKTTASASGAVAIGKNTQSTLKGAVALGSDSTTATNATKQESVTINGITYNFAGATSDTGMQVSVGAAGKERQIKNVAAGEVSATSTDAINGSQLFAVASQIKPVNYFSVKSTAAGNKNNDGATGVNAIAIGPDATATSAQSIALGKSASASGTDSIAIGNGSTAANKVAPVAIGQGAKANGDFSVALGGGNHQFVGAIANGVGSTALGTTSNTADGQNYQTVVGFGANTNKAESTAIGYKATVTVEGGVALGANSSSSTGRTVGYNPNDGRTNTYSALTGNVIRSTTGAIAVGNGSTVTRQITGVAAGTNDTDAVNVAQLKSVNLAFKGNVGSGDVNLATNDSNKKLTIQGDRTYITTNASGNTLTISANKKDINVTNGTARADAGVADAKNVAEAINKAVSQNAYNWYLTADNDTAGSRATINKEGTVKFSGDSNITVARNGNTITTSLNKAITVDSVKANKTITVGTNKITLDGNTGAVTGKAFNGDSFTAGNNVLSNTTLQIGSPTGGNNVSITRDGLTAKAGTKTVKFGTNGIDAGDQQITHVSSGGNVGTNAANITDVKNAVSDVTLKLDTNAKTGNVKLGESPLKVIGANGIRTDLVGTNNGSLVVGLDSNTVNATTKGIGLTGDTGSTGLKYLKDGDATFKVAGDGNLVTTVGSATGVKVSVDSTKVKDLAVEAVTVSKANTVDNPITVTPKAGTNSKEYAIGIDTTKLAAKTHLAYTANGGTAKTVSLAKGLNFVNGTNTVATVDSDGKVSFDLNQATKDSINKSATAVGRTITLNADSGTGSSQSLSNGNVSFAVSGATGDYISTTMDGSAVKVSTKRATINSDANTGAASVTGADGLATAKNVASAINSAVNGLSQNLNISDGTNNSSVALKNQKLTVTGTGAAKTTVNGQTITIDVAKGTLTANANGTATGTAGVADANDVASAINNTNTILGNKITKNAQDIATNTSNITANKNQITTNTTNIATNTTNIANIIALADDKGTSTTAKSLKDGNVSFNIKGDNKFISTAASGNDVTLTVDEQAIKDAAKSASSFKVKANTHAEEEVKGGDTITFNNGDNIEISQTGKTFTIGTAKNITVDSVTAGNTVINTSGLTNGTTAITGTGITTDKVTVGGISIDKTAGINAGGKVISNVASGNVNNNATDDSNAANIGDVKQAVANLSQNLNITDGTNNGTVDLKNQKLNVAGANGVTATVNNQKITVGLDANTVNATTKGIGLTADTGSTGNKYLKDGDVSFAVTGDGNLVSTSATAAGVKVAVDAAKVKDLAVSAVTVSKDAQADNPITVTPTAGANSKDYAIGIDTTKLAAKTDLTYRANSAADANAKKVSLSKGLDFVDGDSTVATVDNDGKVSFDLNTTTKNQINTNTTDIAANKGNITKNTSAIATNTAALARHISLGADTGTASSQSLSAADVAFNVKGATGDFVSTNMNGNTVEISTKRATINSNATTGEASVTGNDGLATAQNVADAINKAADAAKAGAAWNITTNSSTTDKTAVKGGDTVDLVNGDNIEITQDGTDKKKITVATKKDITVDSVTADSVTANNKVTVGSGANKITLDGTDGSVTGKAFTGTTFTGTSFTGTSFTAGNTVINTNGLTNGTTAITGTGVTTDNVTVGGISIDKTAGINAGNKVISNVASGGTTATNAANIGDVKNAVANLSQNLNITDGTHDGTVDLKNQKLNVAGANGVTATVNNQTITVGLDANTVNATTKGIGLTGDTGSTGNKYLKDGDVSFAVTGDGSLVSTSATAAGVKVAVKSASITAGADGTITGPTTDGVATAKNVADAINVAKKASKTEITANTGEAANATTGNVTLTSTTAADGHTIYDVKLNDKVTLGSGANAVTIDGTSGAITGKTATIGGVTVNGTANTIGGLSNTTWNGTAVSGRAATEDQLKAATGATTLKFTGDVAANTGSVNLKDDTFGIKGDGKYISTDVNGKNVNLTVSEAEVKKSAVAAVTVSTDTTDANNPLTVTPTTSADGTTKDYKVTIDGTKIANKTNLSYKANDGTAKQVSLADGLNFKNGTLTTASIDDNGVVKYDVNTASITAGADGTITGPTTDGVATAQNVADAINAAKKASKTEITANTGEAANATTGNVTLTSTTAADGHTIYDVKLNDKVKLGTGANAVTIDGTTGAITGKTATIGGVTVNGTANTIGGLSNTTWNGTATTGRAATEDQLKAVADAASSQTWNITADKAGTTGNQTGTKKNATVGKDETVELVAGDNLTINQNERKFTYSLNKDLAGLTSVSIGTGTTETIKLDGATGKITAKNAAIGGVTIDGDNKHVNGLSNTTWNGTATTGRAATEDQLKAVAETAKTTTDAVNLKFTGDTNTSPGVVNLKDDTFGIVGDGKYVSTDANGKNLTVKVSEAEVKKSAVAAVTVSTDTTDANNPLTVTPTTSADGTTKDYKVTIDGTKIANKTNLSYKANDGTAKQVSLADGLNFKNGTLTTASIDDNGVVKYDVNTASITAGADGTITGPTTDGVATAQNVADAINAAKKASKTEITANTGEAANATTGNVTLTSTTAADGHTVYDVKLNDKVTLGSGANAVTIDGTAGKATIGSSVINGVNNTFTTGGAKAITLDGATGTITGTTANIGGVIVNGTANTIGGLSNTTWNGTATTGRAATEDQLKAVADAAGSQTWEITADKKAGTSGAQTGTKENAKVGKDDKVSLIAGENLTVDQAGKNFTYSLNTDLVKMNSATFEATGGKTTVIKGDSIVQTDGANVNTSNATSNTITDGTNTSTITAGKAQIGTVGIDGVTSKISTGGTNAVVVNGADGTVKTGNVTVTGGTTNDITGLSNTTVTGADFATKGRAATEEQLKAATGATTLKFTGDVATNTGSVNLKDDTFGIKGDGKYISTDVNGKNVNLTISEAEVKKSAVAAVTVSTDTTDANNPLTVTPTTSADGTTKDYKVTIDGTKIANKTHLSYKANDGTPKQVSLADGLNFKNGTLTTASIDDAGVVKYDVNTAAITTGADGTITGPTTDGVATAQNVADAINAAKKASKTEITANTGEAANATTGNVTLTSTTAADGHTIYDVKLNDKVTLGSGVNAVTIDGTAGKATIGSSIVDGVNNTFTTGGASPVTINGATGTITGKTANIGGVTVDGTNNHVMGLANKDWTPGVTQAVSGRAATEDQLQKVSDAVGAGWKVNTGKVTGSTGESNGAVSTKVASGEEVQFQAGNNLIVDQNGKTVAYSLNKALKDLESATINGTGTNKTVITGDSITQTAGTQTNTSTAGGNIVADGANSTAITAAGTTVTTANGNTNYAADGVRINTTGKTPVSLTDAGLDNGNNVIKNVASGHVNNDATDNTNAANIADVKKATTTVTANAGEAANATTGNVTLTSTTAADGHTIYDVKLNDKVTLGSGANAVTIDGTAGKATFGSSVVDGVNNTFTTGGANAVKLDGAAGTIKTGTVTVTGGTTNDITGLSNTTVTAADFATKGRAATEEQLKAVGEQTWQITADKDTATSGAQTGTKKDAKVGKDNKVQLIAGENMTINQNERDFTFTLNKDLVKMNSATFEATGGKTTVIKGDSIVQTAGTQTNTSTAAGNTVADGTKSTETTAAGQVIKDGAKTNTSTVDENTIVDGAKSNKTTVDSNVIDDGNGNVNTSNATSNTITDGTNTSAVTAGKATIGTSVIDGVNNTFTTGGANAVKLDGVAGTIKTGTVTVTGGTTNDITGLSNTTVTAADFATKGRAATEEQLKAVGEQTWQITADKDTATSGAQTGTKKDAKVGKDNKVQLIAGENMTINQNERDFTFTLNKDLVKMNSATFLGTGTNKTVITGDSITQTAGTQTNTSTAGGNTVADGTKSTETTADGQVIKDGAKTNTSTVDENTIVDGTKSNKSTVDGNTITDGTNTTATTSSSVTVKDNAGNSTVITKDNITTGVGANKVTLDGTAGKATIGSSVVDGVNNTFTTGGANAVKLDGVAGTIKTGTVTVTGGTTNDITGLSNTTVTGADFATKGRAATEEQLKAVGEQTWQITADKDATTSGAQTGTKKDAKVGKDDKVQLIAGENMTVNQNERDFTFTLNKDLVKMNSATFLGTGSNTTVITGNSITQTAGTQTNTSTAGGNTVADGTKSTETTAAGQVIKDGAKSNKSTVDNNVIDDGTGNVNTSNATSNTVTDGTNTTATTSSSVTVKDNAGNSTVITKDNITTGVGGNKITLDGTAGKATIGSSIVDGVNNTFTTGGANAVKLDGAAGTIKTGTVTVTGGTTNDITGLSNTTVTGADFATKGRAATEEQLKAVGEQTWQITADKDATTSGAQTGTKKDAKVGKDDKVQLIAGENMTVNQNERDFTFTLNKDLVKMNSATFLGTGSNTTVITGNSITQTAGTQTNTSTAAGNTIANGTKSTETTADGQVIKDGAKSNKSTVDSNVIDDGNGNVNTSNATSNTITDGTNTSTITAGKANIGNIAVDGVNNKITMGNGATPVTLDGANGHLDGLTNTTWVPGVTKATTGRAATEDQLQQVSDAVGAGWKVNTGTVAGSSGVSNGAASTKVSSGEEVKLQAGDNLVIDQNGKTVSYSLNKDLTKMNSATFEATGGKTTVIKGDSIVQTDGGKTNTSNAAGNTVVDGNKSTATTAAGTTITDGAKTNTSTADKNVINDGAGNTNVSNATSNTLKNAAGDETKSDAKGVTVKDAAGNNATFTKDGITITKIGKDTVSLTSDGLDNGKNKIVNVAAGVANTDAVNVGQLKEYAAKSTTELTANNGETAGSTKGNIVLTKTTAADGHTIYDNKLNDKITLGTDPTKAVTVDGTTGTVTGLTNKTWTPGSIVSGRAATEDQLKEAVADSGWKAAVDKEGSGQSTVVGTSPEKIKAEETVTFKAGNNMMVTQTGKSISYAVNPELTNMTSATFKDAAGNTTVTNGNGITITSGSANPTNPHAGPVSLTKDGLNNGNNQIKGVAPGTDPTDAVNVSQLNASNANTSQAINQIAGEVQHVGAHAAAMAALKPIQYDPLEPTQVMAGVGNYRGETAAALGLAHYTNENTMFNVGVSVGGNHNMVNAGVTHKFGYSPEKKNIPDRYKAGPISSVYVMQDEVSSLKKENAEQKYVIADQAARLTTLEAENEQQRRELAETKKGLDDLKAAVDKLLASKG